MKISSISTILFLSLLLPTSALLAETRYIADQLVVNVRSNTGKDYKVLENLKTDTPVEVLIVDGPFVQVRTAKGTTGYIRSQFVSKNTPKPLRIAELKKKAARLQAQLENEQQRCRENSELATSGQGKINSLAKDLQQTRHELEKISSDYNSLQERSEDVINLTTAYDEQNEENNRLSRELAVLQEENKNFHRSNMIQWFLAGGSVFFCGWLAGKISRQKRRFGRW